MKYFFAILALLFSGLTQAHEPVITDGSYLCGDLYSGHDVLEINVKDVKILSGKFLLKSYIPEGESFDMNIENGNLVWRAKNGNYSYDPFISYRDAKIRINRYGIIFSSSVYEVDVPGAAFDRMSESFICIKK